eukprot:m.23202 g.23202  ORF g.23202 m.23202 type:complete len:291 (-) comp3866_c0_seq1:1840-2712(-)
MRLLMLVLVLAIACARAQWIETDAGLNINIEAPAGKTVSIQGDSVLFNSMDVPSTIASLESNVVALALQLASLNESFIASQNVSCSNSGNSGESGSAACAMTAEAYPPVPLVDSDNVSGYAYGNGIYQITCSSQNENEADCAFAFDGNNLSAWYAWGYQCEGTPEGAYVPEVVESTIVSDFGSVNGEWIQIILPNPIILKSYTISAPFESEDSGPFTFALLGGKLQDPWTLLDLRTNVNTWLDQRTQTFTLLPTWCYESGYTKFRLVVSRTAGGCSASIAGWTLFGDEEF